MAVSFKLSKRLFIFKTLLQFLDPNSVWQYGNAEHQKSYSRTLRYTGSLYMIKGWHVSLLRNCLNFWHGLRESRFWQFRYEIFPQILFFFAHNAEFFIVFIKRFCIKTFRQEFSRNLRPKQNNFYTVSTATFYHVEASLIILIHFSFSLERLLFYFISEIWSESRSNQWAHDLRILWPMVSKRQQVIQKT